jgi:hypothetical protein
MWERNYTRSSTILISVLSGSEWSASYPGQFNPGEVLPVPIVVGPRAGLDAAEWREVSASAGNRNPAVQLSARRYTDWALAVVGSNIGKYKNREDVDIHSLLLVGLEPMIPVFETQAQ